MTSEATHPQESSPAAVEPEPEPSAEDIPETHDATAKDQTATTGPVTGPQEDNSASSPPPEPLTIMPLHIFVLAVTYLALLIALFVIYVTWPSFRSDVPGSFGQIPVGVVWFGATGAEIASLYGIFMNNKAWKTSYNYWHYCRPMFGAVTGSIGALMYLILLNLGIKSAVTVDSLTFYAVAFVLGFADKSFMQMLQGVTSVIIKPGSSTPGVSSEGAPNGAKNTPKGG
jgi:hypothetical protein